jgi:very-short-patch-repair endonuclease
MNKICPFCNKHQIGGSAHIYSCIEAPNNIDNIEKKFLYVKINHTKICDKNLLIQLYEKELNSLPMIREKYNIDYKSILFLLTYFNIKKRSISESSFLISQDKYKKTCLNKYGAENALSKNTTAYKKRNENIKTKYGVVNVFQLKEVIDKITQTINTKYGLTKSEFTSKLSREVWAKKTIEEKNNWLINSIHSDKSYIRIQKGYKVSKLELKIQKILNQLVITYTAQFCIKLSPQKRYFYDFLLNDYKLIIEIQGDYWHANPLKYKPNDIILFKFGQITACDIWSKNKLKSETARLKGYLVIEIWESEIIKKTDNELKLLLIDKLKEYEIDKN